MKLKVNNSIFLDEAELQESFVRSGGAGGQNVNKLATAVQLRFDVASSSNLPAYVRDKILKASDARLTKDGILVIFADRFRTQDANRRDARARLFDIIRQAANKPKRRVPTKPSRAARRKRVETKKSRGALKKLRNRRIDLE